jgi:hypothetical protein
MVVAFYETPDASVGMVYFVDLVLTRIQLVIDESPRRDETY